MSEHAGSSHSLTDPGPAPVAARPAVTVLDEPLLEFADGQRVADPHAGLALFGPFDAARPGQPASIGYGVIGPEQGLELFRLFSARIADPVVSVAFGDPENVQKDHLLWPPFPGFRAAFGCEWPAIPAWSRAIDRNKLLTAARHMDKYERAYTVVNMYLDSLRIARERDDDFAVIVCVVPDEVYDNCRPQSRVVGGEGVASSKRERAERRRQGDLFGPYKPEQYDFSVDFRRQLKARGMEFDVPIQLVRESTLRLSDPTAADARNLTKLSDRAWNIGTTLYYKAGRKPWRIAGARPGVCYVGLAFRHSELDDDPRTACCAAQMFLQSGDGVVFRGDFGPWYSPETNAFHLTSDAAEHLLRGVLTAYDEQGGAPLTEIFLHSRSTITDEEMRGYRRACPANVQLVGIRVRRANDSVRFYRPGKWPVLRGTLWVTGRRSAFLWASGFKPSILTYDGWEVPTPLSIRVEHGDADIEQVARDILALTKLNYNTCKLGDAGPVTVGFSDMVGEILIGNPTVRVRRNAFKFYI